MLLRLSSLLLLPVLAPGCTNLEDTLEECSDLVDSDDDGLVDCVDPDCSRFCVDTAGDSAG